MKRKKLKKREQTSAYDNLSDLVEEKIRDQVSHPIRTFLWTEVRSEVVNDVLDVLITRIS